MLNPIKEICQWQIASGNASRPYDDKLEDAFTIEESLEDHGNLAALANMLNVDPNQPKLATALSRRIMDIVYTEPLTDKQRLDKVADKMVFGTGSMQKLGLDHHGVTKALNIVNNANKQKLNAPRDEVGKLLKPDDFVGPEAELQALLDKYNANS